MTTQSPYKSCWTLKCVGVWRARINMLKILLFDFFNLRFIHTKYSQSLFSLPAHQDSFVANVVCVFSKHKHTSGSCPWMSQLAISMSESSHARSCLRSEPRLLIYWRLYAPELPISDSCYGFLLGVHLKYCSKIELLTPPHLAHTSNSPVIISPVCKHG